ncbi:trimeric intracellular cation channel family protein [Veillonella denticariosi JCM 15641]|uniref:Trimeric intracellular cation channel family protein n=1 Tax=Veillonella denticariosi JCM 15641 TaxID=1298594 RepID=A0A2S7ZDA3_9FIRM|nr:trimeric intracellular cation channel family protein [Veillonella denticariosi]PQL21200.1 trimeric intracellular cation channel family protein [Veillonella denticariosi JCM 15641]
MDIIWYIFDMIGTIAFAVSGALVGVARKMDIFGMSVLALATAIGGGIVRDVLLGYFPPNSLRNIVYVTVVIVVTIIVFIIYSSRYRRQVMGPRSRASYLFADAVGLASFTVTGASAGYTLYPDLPIFIVLLGTITAVGGGIIRDMLAQRIPSVLKEDVYALPSIIGGIVYYVMVLYGWTGQAVYGAFSIVLIIRLLAIKYRWSLPKVR